MVLILAVTNTIEVWCCSKCSVSKIQVLTEVLTKSYEMSILLICHPNTVIFFSVVFKFCLVTPLHLLSAPQKDHQFGCEDIKSWQIHCSCQFISVEIILHYLKYLPNYHLNSSCFFIQPWILGMPSTKETLKPAAFLPSEVITHSNHISCSNTMQYTWWAMDRKLYEGQHHCLPLASTSVNVLPDWPI